jgi:hypothetical protein
MSEKIQNEIHMRFRDAASVSLLFAALEKSFPHFHGKEIHTAVDDGGKERREKVFLALKEFSTSFPHPPVDAES